jgi:hypothetical protein
MAVELRCPECRTKLRLKAAPEPDAEIECPKCGHVFPGEANVVYAGAADEDELPKKKRREEPAGKSAEGEKADKAPDEAAKPFKRKKRRAKKRKTQRGVLIGIIAGAVLFVGFVGGTLIWFFTKKSASQEMMTYLPADCDEVSGINIGHLQKYPEFYKSCEMTFANAGFKQAADAFARAIGEQTNDMLEYVVQGSGTSGGVKVEATVLRSKVEFEPDQLAALSGAREQTLDGVSYYTINDPGLDYPGARVFAPTNRLVVFTRGDIPQAQFRAMLTGNKDNLENTAFVRAKPLAKQVSRGTAWKFMLYDPLGKVQRMTPPAQGPSQGGAGESEDDMIRKEIADVVSTAQGCGYKASVGSREVRGEFIVWYKDSEAASKVVAKWKEREWIQDSEKDPPRWWKGLASKSGAGRTAPNALRDGLSFRRSGETFIVRASLETNLLKTGVGALVANFTSERGLGGGAGDGGGVPLPPGGGGGGQQRPPGSRRRLLARR